MEKRRGGMRAIGATLAPMTSALLGKEGAGTAQLIGAWPAIVGDALAESCWPVKLSFRRGERRDGVLKLRVAAALGPEIQHREPFIVERINGYFGYRAVARLAIVQGPPPLPEAPPPPRLRKLAPAEQRDIEARVDGVTDPVLREALARLGTAMLARG